jgi:hypothetical protein
MDTVKSIVGTVQAQLTDQASLIYDQVKSAITTKLDKVMPKKVETPQEPKEEPAKQKPADSFDSPPTEDPDNVSFSRILDKVWYYIQKFVYPLLCVLMASFIANEMIMYAPIIRFAFFTFFLLVCLSSTGILSSMCVYYLLKLLYGIYVNKMTDRPKIKLLPTVYSMLPLIVNRPLLPIAALFLYPFTYPKTQVDEKALLETMVLYQKDLDRSYPAVSADVMPDKVTKAKEYLKHMHDTPKQTEQKGYIEELKKIVPNPGKFHAPIGQMQIEAAKKAKEGAEVAGAAAAVAQQLGIKPVRLYAPGGKDQDITNAISSLKRTIHTRENDKETTLKKIDTYRKITGALTDEQKQAIEAKGYVLDKGEGFLVKEGPAPEPPEEKKELYALTGIGQKQMTPEMKELKNRENVIASWKNRASERKVLMPKTLTTSKSLAGQIEGISSENAKRLDANALIAEQEESEPASAPISTVNLRTRPSISTEPIQGYAPPASAPISTVNFRTRPSGFPEPIHGYAQVPSNVSLNPNPLYSPSGIPEPIQGYAQP